MVIAVDFDDVKGRRDWHAIAGVAGGATQTLFFGSKAQPDLPHASLNEPDVGLQSSTHFHRVDQFQVVVGGKGSIGRHALTPYSVHFTRAYTPYGPLKSDEVEGLKFLVMRARHDAGSQRLPKEIGQLQSVTDRKPWQISRAVTFPPHTDAAGANIAMEAIPGIQDDSGLAAYALNMKAHARATAPDPTHGDGQYLVILKGSAVVNSEAEKNALALIFASPNDGPLQIQAGAVGLEALILNFPVRGTAAATALKSTHAGADFKTWQCLLCAFVYDEATGMPDEGIAPGTRWRDVPETWSCPDCSASKGDFEMAEIKK